MARLARISAGFGLLFAGVLMLALPGPGILTIAGGLALLATELSWARRLLDWVRRRFASYFPKEEAGSGQEGYEGG